MLYLETMARQEWGKTADEWQDLPEEERANMLAFTRVKLRMAAYEYQEREREMVRG